MSEISVDIWSLLLAASAVQGIVMGVLLLSNRTQQQANRMLTCLLLLIIWVQIEFLMVRSAREVDFNLFYGTRHGVWLALGPLLYLYISSFTSDRFRFRPGYLLHFIPFTVFTMLLPLLFAEAIPEQGKYYGMLSVMRSSPEGLTPLQMFYGFLFFLQFIHAGFYAFFGIRALRNFTINQGAGIMIKTARLRWMKRYTIIFGSILLMCLVYFSVLFYSSIYERWMDYLLILPTTIWMYMLAFNAYKNPFLFRDDLKYALSQKKYAKSTLDGGLADRYEQIIIRYLEEEKAYRNPGMKLSDLSAALEVAPHDLSQVINQRFECNFNELINRYRVKEARELLADHSNDLNMLEVAYAVGFNNKASFNNYFKKITGSTPSHYRKNGKNK
ncbi:MAG: AraC family transcriptional regulator [Roseivirga sp.]|nr:AraC family transcriptional regulator [Roseivirga sp.]